MRFSSETPRWHALRDSVGKCLRPCAEKLPAERVVAFFCGADHFAPQRGKLVLQLAEGRTRRAFQRGIDRGHRRDEGRHGSFDSRFGVVQRLIDRRRQRRSQQVIERGFVARVQRLERQIVPGQKARARRSGSWRSAAKKSGMGTEVLVPVSVRSTPARWGR